jgi:hypothetical protein
MTISDPVIISIVVLFQGVCTTAIGAWVAIHNRNESAKEHEETKTLVTRTHNEVNGRMSELLLATKAQGRQDERNEVRDDAAAVVLAAEVAEERRKCPMGRGDCPLT